MDLLKDLRMSLLDFNFAVIYIIHKILAVLKKHLNYLNDNIFECFFKEYDRLLLKKYFLQHVIMGSLSLEVEDTIKDINLFRLEKETKEIKDRDTLRY